MLIETDPDTTSPFQFVFSTKLHVFPAMGKKKTEYETPKMIKAGVKICRPAVAELPGAKRRKFSQKIRRSQKKSRN